MDRGTIRTNARYKLNETSAKFWTDAELNSYINEGNRYYWSLLILAQDPLTIKETNLTITSGTESIALPSDFIKIRLIERAFDSYDIPLKYKERYDTANGTSTSSAGNTYLPSYRVMGSNLILEPTPQSTLTNGLVFTYFYQTADLDDDTDSPEFNAHHHDILVDFCCVRAKEKEELIGGGGTGINSFKEELSRKEQIFKEMVETVTLQRRFVQPWVV